VIENRLLNNKSIIFSIPHSGFNYSSSFLKSSSLDMNELRRSEDIFVDELWMPSINNGYTYIKALFPRIYIDVNRHPLELDSEMFSSIVPQYKFNNKLKVKYGIGLISKLSIYGNQIYRDLLSRKELRHRLLNYYFPYHKIIKNYISNTLINHKNILILDCHSMPSVSLLDNDIDLVLGTNMGKSVSKNLIETVYNVFNNYGFKIQMNKPYSGGFITQYYGKPNSGVNVIQIEINRKKYINEKSLKRNLNSMRSIASRFQKVIIEINKKLNINN